MVTSAGDRRSRVSFQQRAEIDDGAGNKKGAWIALCGPYWAKLRPLGGKEEVLAQKVTGTNPFELTVMSTRQTRRVTTACRAVDARDPSRVFNITAIANPDQRNIDLVMILVAGPAVG